MKRFALTAATAASLIAAPAFAASIFEEVDADGSGTLSLEELQVAYPDVTAEVFGMIDANGDGEAEMEDLIAAQEGGLLPAQG